MSNLSLFWIRLTLISLKTHYPSWVSEMPHLEAKIKDYTVVLNDTGVVTKKDDTIQPEYSKDFDNVNDSLRFFIQVQQTLLNMKE